MNEMRGLAPLVGKTLPGEDPLAAHADLRQAVAEGKITQQYANEVAQSRGRGAAAQKLSQNEQQMTRQQAEDQRAWDEGKAALTALGNELRQSDPLYAQKEAILKPKLGELLRDIPPHLWAAKTRQLFALQQVAAPAPVAPAAPKGPQPLRSNKGAPGAATGGPPKTMGQAIAGIDFSQVR
jgi:hypothetical protein